MPRTDTVPSLYTETEPVAVAFVMSADTVSAPPRAMAML